MILRRLSASFARQDWTAIAIELVIVVLGVFIGLQAANWNDDRQQAARQGGYLERLRIDFDGIRDRIQEHFVIYRDAAEGADRLLALLDADAGQHPPIEATDEQISRAFNALISTRIPPPLPATYVEMRSEGQLGHIRNPHLRDKLGQYDRLLGVVQEVARITGDNFVALGPVLQRHFSTRSVIDDTSLSGIRNDVLGFDVAGMRSDRDFAVAVRVLQRGALNSRAQRQRQLELIEQILALIGQEQNR